MKIAHISDLHLGKIVHSYNLLFEQKLILDQVINNCLANQVGVLLIAGDIYDRPVASSEAINVFENFIEELVANEIKCLIIGGNHDGYRRLSYAKKYLRLANIIIKADFDQLYEKIRIDNVDFYLINHLDPIHVNQQLEDIKTHDEMMAAIINQIESEIDQKQTNILMVHGYVAKIASDFEQSYEEAGLIIADTERPLSIGTSDIVASEHFNCFDYVALGHLHQAQSITKNIYYSGSIFPYSFSESNNKGMYIYNTQTAAIEFQAFTLERKLRTISGSFESIMNTEDYNCDDYVELVLSEESLITNLMDKVKQKYPNTMLIRTELTNGAFANDISIDQIKNRSTNDLFIDFCREIYDYKISETEANVFTEINNEEEECKS